ncbi:MAG: hypothetical protein PSX81_09135 [bacterium]|nr:hypothetical protein [bacterium]
MKVNNIKIAILETGNFYQHLLGNQISELCSQKKLCNCKWLISNFEDSNKLVLDLNPAYQLIVIDNYFRNGHNKTTISGPEIMETLKEKNKNCMYITISGMREMLITAERLNEGERTFFYSKLCNAPNAQLMEHSSNNSIQKLIARFFEAIPSSHLNGQLKVSA